ncbi:MAG: ABC transporter permease [Phycisphaerae bacterium]|nr:ABC transporter permease [Saprospiraceae bacterium]
MIQNNLKIALRKLAKQPTYTSLNILGLALSVGCSILIFTLIRYHLSFDTYHKNADRILRIMMDVKTESVMPFPGVPTPMAKTLREECSFVEKTAMRSGEDEVLISVANQSGGKDKYKEEEKFAWVEPEYFDILDLPLLRGDVGALAEPNTVVLSEKLARKYFGETEAIGKTIRQNNQTDLRVVGVMQDLPENTDYKHEILASWATLKTIPDVAKDLDSWDGARGENYCFALLKEGHALSEMDPMMAEFRKKYPHPEKDDLFQYKAKPMLGLHFDTDYGAGMDKKFLWALGFIGLFLLITACVNFINMATAQALTRVREVGVRKALGSTRGQLFWQFMSETGLIVLASLAVGFLLAWLAMPYMNAWLDETIHFDNPTVIALAGFSVVLGVFLTFLAGFYPGLMQARFNPVISMKGASELPTKGGFSMRRVLVTTQFAISQILIIGAAVVTAQMRYAQDADWGFRPGTVLTLEVPDRAKSNSLQQQISQLAGVKSVSLCYQPPTSSSNNQTGVTFENRPEGEAWLANAKPADARYLETFGLQLVAGRNLQPSDTTREFIVNETFVKKLNLASPDEILNKKISLGSVKAPVVGVVRDFHNWSLAEPIAAIAISSRADDYTTCAVQLNPGNPAPVLAQIQRVWEQHFPDNYYESKFMDERVGEQLETETMIMRLARSFAGIAIFIGCLGLYGLATFLVAQKRKEVGIRKTLGAGVAGILWLFGKEYTRLIVIAFVLAAPLAWWVMDAWLQDYAYRISLGAGIFVLSLLVTFGVAALTVGFQSVRAALANPVNSLRSE